MAQDDIIIGHITLRIPIHAYTESESCEIAEEYTVLYPGDPDLIEHDLPAAWHGYLPEFVTESGLGTADWTDEQIAASCTRTEGTGPFGPNPVEDLLTLR